MHMRSIGEVGPCHLLAKRVEKISYIKRLQTLHSMQMNKYLTLTCLELYQVLLNIVLIIFNIIGCCWLHVCHEGQDGKGGESMCTMWEKRG